MLFIGLIILLIAFSNPNDNTGDECMCHKYPANCRYFSDKIHELNGD